MTQSLGSLLSKLAVLGRFSPNLVHLKTCKDWHYVSGALGVLMTQNIESLKSKIAEIFLLYFRPSRMARSSK